MNPTAQKNKSKLGPLTGPQEKVMLWYARARPGSDRSMDRRTGDALEARGLVTRTTDGRYKLSVAGWYCANGLMAIAMAGDRVEKAESLANFTIDDVAEVGRKAEEVRASLYSLSDLLANKGLL